MELLVMLRWLLTSHVRTLTWRVVWRFMMLHVQRKHIRQVAKADGMKIRPVSPWTTMQQITISIAIHIKHQLNLKLKLIVTISGFLLREVMQVAHGVEKRHTIHLLTRIWQQPVLDKRKQLKRQQQLTTINSIPRLLMVTLSSISMRREYGMN